METAAVVAIALLTAALIAAAVAAAVGWGLYLLLAAKQRKAARSAHLLATTNGIGAASDEDADMFPDIEAPKRMGRPDAPSRIQSQRLAFDTALAFSKQGDADLDEVLRAVHGGGGGEEEGGARGAASGEVDGDALSERLRAALPASFGDDDLSHLVDALETDAGALTAFKDALAGAQLRGPPPEWEGWREVTGNSELSEFSTAYLAFPSSRRRFLQVERDLAIQEEIKWSGSSNVSSSSAALAKGGRGAERELQRLRQKAEKEKSRRGTMLTRRLSAIFLPGPTSLVEKSSEEDDKSSDDDEEDEGDESLPGPRASPRQGRPTWLSSRMESLWAGGMVMREDASSRSGSMSSMSEAEEVENVADAFDSKRRSSPIALLNPLTEVVEEEDGGEGDAAVGEAEDGAEAAAGGDAASPAAATPAAPMAAPAAAPAAPERVE